MDELGLLPKDMTVEESQQLVTGMYQNPSVINPLGESRGSNENFDCLVTGRITEIHMFDLLYYILDTILWWIRNDVTWNSFNFPFFYGKIGYISFSWYEAEEWGDDRYHKSKGWVWTKGTNGTVTWNGELGGNLGAECVLDNRQLGLTVYVYMGIADFKGLWIDSFSRYTYFLGNAAHISLRYV